MTTPENPPKLWCFTLPTELAGDVTLLAETEAGAIHLRKQEPNASSIEHARRAIAEVGVLITELQHEDKPMALPANVPLETEPM